MKIIYNLIHASAQKGSQLTLWVLIIQVFYGCYVVEYTWVFQHKNGIILHTYSFVNHKHLSITCFCMWLVVLNSFLQVYLVSLAQSPIIIYLGCFHSFDVIKECLMSSLKAQCLCSCCLVAKSCLTLLLPHGL